MSRRKQLEERIQALSREEGLRQPSAAEWLAQQDSKTETDPDPDPGRPTQEKDKHPGAQDDLTED